MLVCQSSRESLRPLIVFFLVAFEINYPHFINKQNSSPRVTRDLRAALDTLPSLKCMQIAGTRPALSNLLSNQPTLASSLTVLHVADLGDPMSKPAKDPADLAFLDFIKTANNLKTLVMTAIQPLEHASEREQWWRAVLAPRSHKLALSLTNPHPIPTSLTSSPQEMATSVRDEKASLHHLHLHFSRREGDFNQLAQIKARCNDFADLTHLGLSGYTSPPSQAVLQPDFMPHLKELTIDTMPPMISESDKNCMRQWLRTWKPAVLKISAWPDVPLDVLTSILTHPDTSAIKHVHCYRGAWQIFATLDAWLQFKNSLEAAPSARQVTADSGFEHILTQPEFDASSGLFLCLLKGVILLRSS